MAEEGAVIGCHTIEQWNYQLEQASDSNKLVIVDFTASWCPPCRMIAPIFAELAKKFTTAVFLKVDVDELNELARNCKVEAMPTFIFMKAGEVVGKLVGANKEELPKSVELLVNSYSSI